MTKNLSVILLIWGTICIIWFMSFMLWFCKMMISPGGFFHFFKLRFLGGNRAETGPYLRNHISNYFHLWYKSVKWWYFSTFFFLFFQKLIFKGWYGSKRAKNGPKWQKLLSVVLHISKSYIIWLSLVVHKCKTMISLGFLGGPSF